MIKLKLNQQSNNSTIQQWLRQDDYDLTKNAASRRHNDYFLWQIFCQILAGWNLIIKTGLNVGGMIKL